jgi:hypothetical protein
MGRIKVEYRTVLILLICFMLPSLISCQQADDEKKFVSCKKKKTSKQETVNLDKDFGSEWPNCHLFKTSFKKKHNFFYFT